VEIDPPKRDGGTRPADPDRSGGGEPIRVKAIG
jgi:hypothetical protein